MAIMDMPEAGPLFVTLSHPNPNGCFHRAIAALFRFGFDAGFVVDGLEEPHFPGQTAEAGVHWRDMPDIPPVMVVRMKLIRGHQTLAGERQHGRRRDSL